MKQKHFLTAMMTLATALCIGQQVSDTAFTYVNPNPRFASGKGPVVWLDEAHYNFHTLDGRYISFGKVVAGDGYRLGPNRQPFSEQSLVNCRILVIANALDSLSNTRWTVPNRSAFSPEEISAVKNWVKNGGRLFLIADHMPFAGSAQDLARAFDVEMLNCFAMDNRRRAPERFYKSNQTLINCPLTRNIDTIVTFTGSAFRLPEKAQPVLALQNYTILQPGTAWQFTETTPYSDSEGLCQLGYLSYGRGKVVVSGEAAMFSAQLSGPNQIPFGMNQAEARQNAQLLLQIMEWLDN